MKIAIYMTTILEHAGGLENTFMSAARYLAEMPDVSVDVITMDEIFTKRLGKVLSFYYGTNLNKAELHRETTQAASRKLGNAKYYKCANFAELFSHLSKCDVIYSKNEILEAL